MKEAVVIKSYSNGITMILNDEMPFDDIIQEIESKFKESKSFFGKAKVALSFEGRHLNYTEELSILDAIKENSDIHIICIIGKDEETNKHFIKALQKVKEKMPSESDGQFYKGSLTNKEVLETETSIVILGDIYPGCSVISPKNIIVLGGLYGEAHAGCNGEEGAYIAALEMEPEKLKIGDFKYKTNTKQTKWGIRPKVQPRLAFLKNNKITFEPLTKDILNTF